MFGSRLTVAAKNFAASQNNTEAHVWNGVAVSLNAAGTQITVAEAGADQERWQINAVEVR